MKNNEGSNVNYSDMKLPELKAIAKDKAIKGFSTMKKADLVAALTAADKPAEKVSFIDALKASFAVNREARSAKGRKAGAKATNVVDPKVPAHKAAKFRLQRGSETAKLTPAQARRVRKAEAKLWDQRKPDGFVCTGMGATNLFTYV